MDQARIFKIIDLISFSIAYLVPARINISRLSFLVLINFILFAACSNIPQADYYEVDGIVSGEFSDTTNTAGWKSTQFINSRGLRHNPTDTSYRIPLSASIYISNSGPYSFWLLTAFPGLNDSLSVVDLSISGPDDFLVSRANIEVEQQNDLTWRRAVNDEDSNLISFDRPGLYSISITPRGSDDIQIHKFQMSLNNSVRPFGLGLPPSKRTDLSSADLFRELPIMLPPSWVFIPVVGFDTVRSEDFFSEGSFDDILSSDKLGAVWAHEESEQLSGIQAFNGERDTPAKGIKSYINQCFDWDAETLFESGIEFIVTKNSSGVECLTHLHQQYQQVRGDNRRSVFFHGIKNAYKSDMKQFPAPITPLYDFKWSAPQLVEENTYRPGGYRELIDDISNPGGSLYNMPFLSLPINYSKDSALQTSWDSELFIRSIQLSVFMPVMHLIFPEDMNQLSEPERMHLEKALQLRNSLFHYSYTHAHYTRQTNESIIAGFRDYPNQYLYGDAFLVAPATAPGNDGRLVYFPQGRRWYNYHTGEAYTAGQSWFIETSLDYLPLFVKAGSVIPFIDDAEPDDLKIDVYTGDAGAFRLVEDDGETRAYRRAEAARTMFRYNEIGGNLKLTIGAVQAAFEGMSEQRSYNIHFKYRDRPDSIDVNGDELEMSLNSPEENSWRYDEDSKSIILNLNNMSRREKTDIIIYQ